MNHYTQLLYFLKQLAESHPLVNTVTQGNADQIDLEKSNIFPLVHLTIEDASFTNGKVLNFPVTIECLTERDFNKEVIDNKFWKQDNEVDNHNETLAILNYMWTALYRDWNQNNLTTSEDATVTKIEFERGNVLDGWSLAFEVEVPNTDLCLELVPDEVTIDLSSTEGGTASSSLGTEVESPFTVNKNNNEAFNATPETGYRFRYWLLNGIQNLINPLALIITKNYNIVADFIKTWVLTISADGNGTVTPESGTYDDQEQITLTATPNDVDTQFDRWESLKLGTVTDNPLAYTVTQDDTITGFFTALLQIVQDIFTTTPIYDQLEWKFIDQSGVAERKPLNVICGANSIVKGTYGAPTSDPFPTILQGLLNVDDTVINVGIDAYSGNQFYDNYDTHVTANIDPDKRNVLYITEILNDIGVYGRTPAEAENYIRLICEKAQSQGLYVIVGTTNVTNTANESLYRQASDLVVTNYTDYADALLRVDQIAEYQNPATYTSDGVHIIDYNFYANALYPLVDAVTANNDVKIRKHPSLYFDSTTYVSTGKQIDATSDTNIKMGFKIDSSKTGVSTTLLYDVGNGFRWLFFQKDNNDRIAWFPRTSEGGFQTIPLTSVGTYDFNSIYEFDLTISPSLNTITGNIYEIETDVNNIVTSITTITVNESFVGTLQTGGTVDVGYFSPTNQLEGFVYYLEIDNDINIFPTELQGNSLYDENLTDVYTINGLATWGNSGFKPYALIKGATIYVKDSDSSILMVIGNSSRTITGFTKDQYYAAGSGILKDLTNTYLGILNNPTVEQDYNTLDGIPPSSTYVPTKTANTISRLIIKQ